MKSSEGAVGGGTERPELNLEKESEGGEERERKTKVKRGQREGE
jgi:hypothetical protein